MQWGHIKTLFILSFLILNIYLVSAFIDRQQDIGYLETRELPIEEQLASENITYDALEVEVDEAAYISVMQKVLTDEDLQALETFDNQDIAVVQNSLIVSKLNEVFPVSEEMPLEELEAIVQNQVLYGDEYVFWNWNTELNMLVFFQEKEDQPIYYNENGILLVYLNEAGEITHYTQSVLGESEIQGKPVVLNQPIQVISTLYRGSYLSRGDEVTDMDLGFYSRIVAEGIQVFAPTWEVQVNKEKSYFVNAIEGVIYQDNEAEFLSELIEMTLQRITSLDGSDAVVVSLVPLLMERVRD